MQDRQPGAPGQYKATLTAAEFQKMQAGEQFTITMTRDDQPIVEGTPYSKAAVLPDDLAAIVCPDVLNPNPADALGGLLPRNGKASMTGDLDMAEHQVKHVADPTEAGDAVNLGYVRDHVYPVGAIYMSVANASPASFLGGTWTQLKDRFLLGAGSSYTAGGTGGEASHTLTTSEIPEHAHGMKAASSSGTPGYFPVILTEGWGPSEWETKERGSSGAHNNMPPYLVVYMWKRIA